MHTYLNRLLYGREKETTKLESVNGHSPSVSMRSQDQVSVFHGDGSQRYVTELALSSARCNLHTVVKAAKHV